MQPTSTHILNRDPQPTDHPFMASDTAISTDVANDRGSPQAGFTLLELLVVIAVLSVLAGGAVLAVGAMKGSSQEVACSTDERTLDTAEQALLATTGSAGDEALLVSSGYIDGPSEYHDIALSGSEYKIVAVGPCVSNGGGGGPVEIAGPADPDLAKNAETTEPKPVEPTKPETTKPKEPETTKPDPTASGCKEGQVDINSASAKELDTIKYVGEKRAQLIIKQRPFKSIKQLEEVYGLGEFRVGEIMEQGVACIR